MSHGVKEQMSRVFLFWLKYMSALVEGSPRAVLPLEVIHWPLSSHEDQGSGSRDDTLSFQPASNPTMQ